MHARVDPPLRRASLDTSPPIDGGEEGSLPQRLRKGAELLPPLVGRSDRRSGWGAGADPAASQRPCAQHQRLPRPPTDGIDRI
ncbi:hypothetical protein EFV37_04770 [Mesorhizobium loti]|uniref:Uncharacterized protein n=1 Tax=Mesorhizobium jarvisii TaxID=1777867 RepID=A0A6M7TDV2_9HYPH|nr:hypothetical protein EB229_04770 [Mesorhizobium jarvisii]QKD07596.1 hypothetical protein EFV37_04770 [Mesorhizobium loti]RJT35371.1 hypothetical protein D3242_07745 [Mesorhizobium jarvisii]